MYGNDANNFYINSVSGNILPNNLDNGLILYWSFENNSYNEIITDATPISVGGTPSISTSIYKIGSSSLSIPNGNSYLNFYNSAGFLPATTNGYSFSIWFNLNTAPAGQHTLYQFSEGGGNGYNNIMIYFNGSSLLLSLYRGGGSYIYNLSNGGDFTISSVSTNIWYHLVVILPRDSGVTVFPTIYLNNQNIPCPYYIANAISLTNSRVNCCIGSVYDIASVACNGYIDDFRVYNRILSTIEVNTLYLSSDDIYKKTIDTLSTDGYNSLVYQGTTLQAGAYGVKLLLYSYRNSSVIQIKAGTGGTPTNFYAPVDGTSNLTTGTNGTGTGIVAFLNGDVGYVTMWYDQTGNGHHATASGNTLPFYNTTNAVVDFGDSGFFTLEDNSFPTGNLPYSYIFKQGRVPGGNSTVWSGGTWGTFGLMELLILSPTYNDTWYAYDFYGMTPVANALVAVTYGGAGNNTGVNGKKFYINNVLQNPPSIDNRTNQNAPRAQTANNCYFGASHPDGRGTYGSYNSTTPYFYWMPYQLDTSDIAILENT